MSAVSVETGCCGWLAVSQDGLPGHCTLAQVFDPQGNSIATFDATSDPRVATERARTLARALGGCRQDDHYKALLSERARRKRSAERAKIAEARLLSIALSRPRLDGGEE